MPRIAASNQVRSRVKAISFSYPRQKTIEKKRAAISGGPEEKNNCKRGMINAFNT